MPHIDSEVKDTPNIYNSKVLHNKKNFLFFFFLKKTKQLFTSLVITAAPLFFCTLTSPKSISEPNNQVCVLGAINERYGSLCDVHMGQNAQGKNCLFDVLFNCPEQLQKCSCWSVGPLVGQSVGHVCEKGTFRVEDSPLKITSFVN